MRLAIQSLTEATSSAATKVGILGRVCVCVCVCVYVWCMCVHVCVCVDNCITSLTLHVHVDAFP